MQRHREVSNWCLPKRVAYVVDHSFPYSSDGYAVRTHEIARALNDAGHDVIVFNRPGRPWNIKGFDLDQDVPTDQIVDGVRYVFLPAPLKTDQSIYTHLREAEHILTEAFEVYRPGAVLAASNWENARPAMYVARHMQIPFFYEQRGFWEITQSAAEPEYENSEDFRRVKDNETHIANAARTVFTLNEQMRQELVKRGIAPDKIQIVPNGVSRQTHSLPQLARADLGVSSEFLIGYVGSLNAYEGVSDLLPLLASLRRDGVDVDLMIVGSDAAAGLIGSDDAPKSENNLQHQAKQLGLSENVHFIPQLSHDIIGSYYQILDALIIPRRRTNVTELVSPLKPYTAAAYGIPIFMSDLPPLKEIADEIGATLFPEGNIEALASNLKMALTSKTLNSHAAPNASIAWLNRILPISNALAKAAEGHPELFEMIGLKSPGATKTYGSVVSSFEHFDLRTLPSALINSVPSEESIVSIGPSSHLVGKTINYANRATLLPTLASQQPGLFIIDWPGIFGICDEWGDLWSLDNMRLNRQIMDACRIGRDRGWKLQVIGPVSRSKSPLFQTVRNVLEEVILPPVREQL